MVRRYFTDGKSMLTSANVQRAVLLTGRSIFCMRIILLAATEPEFRNLLVHACPLHNTFAGAHNLPPLACIISSWALN